MAASLALAGAAPAPPDPRVALMDAAARLYVERGVEAVGLDEIAAAAGMAAAESRRHYPSADVLRLALRERYVAQFCARVEQAMAACRDDWNARLRAWVHLAVDDHLDRTALHDAVFHDIRALDRQACQDNPVVDQLTAMLEGGAAARVWAVPDPRLTAVMFFTMMHGAVDRAIACGEPYDRRRLTQTLIGYFERAVQWWARF